MGNYGSGPDFQDFKDGVKQGVTKVAGRLSNIASGVMNSLQVCIMKRRSKQKYFSCKKGLIYVLRSIMKLQLGFNGKLLYLDMKYEDSYNGFPFNT